MQDGDRGAGGHELGWDERGAGPTTATSVAACSVPGSCLFTMPPLRAHKELEVGDGKKILRGYNS